MRPLSPFGAPRRLLHPALLLVLVAGGCSGGSTSVAPVSPTPPPVFEVSPTVGGAGDLVTIRATGVDPDPANSVVTFVSDSGTIELRAPIVDLADVGTQTGHGTIRRLRVIVPGGVRTGSVTLESDGNPLGGAAFEAAPEVVGVAVGSDGDFGALSRNVAGTLFPTEVLICGYNLIPAVTDISLDDGTQTFPNLVFAFGPPPAAGFSVPPGLEMLRVTLPAGLSPLTCETVALTFVLESQVGVNLFLRSAPVSVPIGSISLGGQVTDVEIPAWFSGAQVPPGVRLGEVAIDFGFLMDPASSRYAVTVEYQDPADSTGATWLPCTPAASSFVGDRLPGGRAERPGGAIIGPGAPHRFVWRSDADLPAAEGAVGTRLRLRATDPVPLPSLGCPTGEWITPVVVVDNSQRAFGAAVEEFEDVSHLDPTGGNAIWSFGELSAPASGGSAVPAWGNGSAAVTIVAGSSAVIDTSARTITDVTIPGAPVDLLPSNPGAAAGEFHVRSFAIEAGAAVSVTGTAPLIIRCAGDGTDSFLALSLAADLILDGAAGGAGTAANPGAGGAAGPGGGNGGTGGRVEVDGTGSAVVDLVPAERGGLAGGGAGQGTTLALEPPSASVPRAGCGGGGAGASAGEAGIIGFDAAANPIAVSGAGAPARGDVSLTLPAGGSGGGGGGACAVRLSGPAGLTEKHGGGGGGGGGAVEIVVRGRAELSARISARGGNGAIGSQGSQAGAGGGGGGGSIAIRATGALDVLATAVLDTAGGAGAVVVASATPHRSGAGSAGTIRLESNAGVTLPNPAPPGLFVGAVSDGPFLAAGRLTSRARSRPYELRTDGGIAVARPVGFDPAAIVPGAGVPPASTHVIALYEGAEPSADDPFEPGEFSVPVGDPTLLDHAEFIRVRWFLWSAPGTRAAVDSWTLPFD